ncbi:MAG: RNA methyltransferase [Kineosporiaceae bacterium]|nr:RNA methyltransferase [Kineosporiaceae bacterium]MBK7624910.1 RNA methyltransferase [Kineosporiaceae bacterium]MBK8076711.1 RNA methyltransferase [Kineosporiaceae bacterium]
MSVEPELIEGIDDPRMADYARLTDVALRRLLDVERGLYLAESEKVIRRALDAGHRPRSMLLAERWLEPLAGLVSLVTGLGAPVFTGPDAVLEQITGFHVHRGAIASMHRPVLRPPAELVAGARRVLVLEDIVDHTNVGAIFRSAAGIGADAVLVTPRCADPLYRRSVRVSMGTVFQVPWGRIDPWPAGLDHLHDAGFTVVALALTPEAITLDDLAADLPDRLALVLGTEGDGLSRAALARADRAVRIPMAGAVDSLNVAAAAAVALWAVRPR